MYRINLDLSKYLLSTHKVENITSTFTELNSFS